MGLGCANNEATLNAIRQTKTDLVSKLESLEKQRNELKSDLDRVEREVANNAAAFGAMSASVAKAKEKDYANVQKTIDELVVTVNHCCAKTLQIMQDKKQDEHTRDNEGKKDDDPEVTTSKKNEEEFNKVQVLHGNEALNNNSNNASVSRGFPLDGTIRECEMGIVFSPIGEGQAEGAPEVIIDDIKASFSNLSDIRPSPSRQEEGPRSSTFKKAAQLAALGVPEP